MIALVENFSCETPGCPKKNKKGLLAITEKLTHRRKRNHSVSPTCIGRHGHHRPMMTIRDLPDRIRQRCLHPDTFQCFFSTRIPTRPGTFGPMGNDPLNQFPLRIEGIDDVRRRDGKRAGTPPRVVNVQIRHRTADDASL